QKSRGVSQNGGKKRPQVETNEPEIFLVTREGSVGNAPAREDYGDVSLSRFTKEIGPDFCFEHDDQGGLHRGQDPTHAEGPVERIEKHCVGKGHTLFCKRVTGQSGRGDNQWPFWICFLQPLS